LEEGGRIERLCLTTYLRVQTGLPTIERHLPSWRRAENTIPKPKGSICLANSADTLIG